MIRKLQKSMYEKDKGFTLIELLVVVIIIGILAGIAIPVFLNQRKKGVDAGLKSDLKNAATTAATMATDSPTSTTVFTQSALETAGWKHDGTSTFTVSGTPAAGNFCISAFNTGATADATAKQFYYNESTGGMRAGAPGAGC